MGEPVQKRARGRQANQRSLSQSEEIIPSYLSSFMKEITDSLNQFKVSLVKEIKTVISESLSNPIVDKISCRIDKVVNDSFSNIMPTGSNKSTYAQVVAANIDLQRYPEKSTQAVICNIPEHDTPEETDDADIAALKTMFQATSLKEKWDKGEVQWFRHPKDAPRDSKRRGRPIKVKLASQQDQETFIKEANKVRHSTFTDQPHLFVRRDLTPKELEIDSELRRECGKRNQQLGLIKYVVRDLEIHEIKNPKHKVKPRDTNNTTPIANKQKPNLLKNSN